MIKWKKIDNGNYSISNTGLVKSNKRFIQTKTGTRIIKEKYYCPKEQKMDI